MKRYEMLNMCKWLLCVAMVGLLVGCAGSRAMVGAMQPEAELPGVEWLPADGLPRDPLPGELGILGVELEQAWEHFARTHAAGDQDAVIIYADAFAVLARSVGPHVATQTQRVWVDRRLIQVERELERARILALLAPHFETYEQTPSYREAITAADAVVAILRDALVFQHWTYAERVQLDEAIMLWGRQHAESVRLFSENLQRAERDLCAAQSRFFDIAARRDLDTAIRLIDGQNRKRMNWRVLGHWRDDPQHLATASVILNRVQGEERVDARLRTQAQGVAMGLDVRMKNRAIRAAKGKTLPRYERIAGYPHMTRQELEAQADGLRQDDWQGDNPAVGAREYQNEGIRPHMHVVQIR